MKKILSYMVMACLVVTLSSCGTILYPERRGQTGGQLDAGIVLLDAIGLLFFFLPGVIAFAVDFSNGTIYLPDGSAATMSEEELEAVRSNGRVDVEALNALIREKTGQSVAIDAARLEVSRMQSASQLPTAFTVAGNVGLARL